MPTQVKWKGISISTCREYHFLPIFSTINGNLWEIWLARRSQQAGLVEWGCMRCLLNCIPIQVCLCLCLCQCLCVCVGYCARGKKLWMTKTFGKRLQQPCGTWQEMWPKSQNVNLWEFWNKQISNKRVE